MGYGGVERGVSVAAKGPRSRGLNPALCWDGQGIRENLWKMLESELGI